MNVIPLLRIVSYLLFVSENECKSRHFLVETQDSNIGEELDNPGVRGSNEHDYANFYETLLDHVSSNSNDTKHEDITDTRGVQEIGFDYGENNDYHDAVYDDVWYDKADKIQAEKGPFRNKNIYVTHHDKKIGNI